MVSTGGIVLLISRKLCNISLIVHYFWTVLNYYSVLASYVVSSSWFPIKKCEEVFSTDQLPFRLSLCHVPFERWSETDSFTSETVAGRLSNVVMELHGLLHKQNINSCTVQCENAVWSWDFVYIFICVLASKQTAVCVWQTPVAVCTVLNSWWWTERPSETCRVSFQSEINLIHWCIWLVLL